MLATFDRSLMAERRVSRSASAIMNEHHEYLQRFDGHVVDVPAVQAELASSRSRKTETSPVQIEYPVGEWMKQVDATHAFRLQPFAPDPPVPDECVLDV